MQQKFFMVFVLLLFVSKLDAMQVVSHPAHRISNSASKIKYLLSTKSQTDESSVLSKAPRVLVCEKVRKSDSRCATHPKVPSYATELSQWVLDRRLNQLSQEIDKSSLMDSLKERFNYKHIWLSTTSNAVFDYEGYRFVVHHAGIDTKLRYYCAFDVFLKDDPLKLWIEGQMSVSEIRWEEGSIRDAYDLRYSFKVLKNSVFAKGLLEDHFSGDKIKEDRKTLEMKKLIEDVLSDKILNRIAFWNIKFIPFVGSNNE